MLTIMFGRMFLPEPLEETLGYIDYQVYKQLLEIPELNKLFQRPFWKNVIERFDFTKIQKWLEGLGKKYTENKLQSLEWLSLWNNNLTEIPKELGQLQFLVRLDLDKHNAL